MDVHDVQIKTLRIRHEKALASAVDKANMHKGEVEKLRVQLSGSSSGDPNVPAGSDTYHT